VVRDPGEARAGAGWLKVREPFDKLDAERPRLCCVSLALRWSIDVRRLGLGSFLFHYSERSE